MPDSVFGVVGLFDSADALTTAIPMVKARGFRNLHAYTPYPVHGVDELLDLPESKLGVLVFLIGSIACIAAFTFEWWTSTVAYPLLTAGKPYNGWPGWVLVMVESTILFSTLTTAIGMLFAFNKLPYFGNPMLGSDAIAQVTRDRFALMAASDHGALDVPMATDALRAVGATALEVVYEPAHPRPGLPWALRTAATIVAASTLAGVGTWWAIRTYPTVKPMANMEVQPRLDAQRPDAFFANGRGMLRPPEASVPRGQMPILDTIPDDPANTLVNPLPVTYPVLARGRTMFDQHCAVCHDRLGTGHPWLDSTYQAFPVDLQTGPIRTATDGMLYWVISQGIRTMPGYAADIGPDDRWAIVRYIRALQRSQDAPERDLR
jgi:mono/diheme cytochrome c family protein